jgi:hypothetical protein
MHAISRHIELSHALIGEPLSDGACGERSLRANGSVARFSRPTHLGWLRYSSFKFQQYAPSSRLASRAPQARSSTDSIIREPLRIE